MSLFWEGRSLAECGLVVRASTVDNGAAVVALRLEVVDRDRFLATFEAWQAAQSAGSLS